MTWGFPFCKLGLGGLGRQVSLTCHPVSPFFHPMSSPTAHHENGRNHIGAICEIRAVAIVLSEATGARTRKDKAPAVNASTPPGVRDTSESSLVNPRSTSPHHPQQEAYVTVDALKNFMSTMTDTIMRQVSKQVQRAMQAANWVRPLPHFDYVPTTTCTPSHWLTRVSSPRHTDRDCKASQSNRNGRPRTGNHDWLPAATTRPSSWPDQGQSAKYTTTSTPYATHSRRTAWFEEQEQTSKPRRETLGWPQRTPERCSRRERT